MKCLVQLNLGVRAVGASICAWLYGMFMLLYEASADVVTVALLL